MKKTIFTILLSSTLAAITAQSKCGIFEDTYETNSGWTSVNTDIKIANGVVKAVNVGANLKPNRIYKKFVNKVLATDDWVLETSFTDQTPSNAFSCYELVSLTVDEMDPSVICSGTSTGCTINLNGKNNMVFTIVKPSNDVTKTYAILNLNDVASEQIIIKSGVKYFPRIEKKGSILTLSLFTDEARTVHETGSPKTITAKTLSDLNYIQHGVATKGGDFRSSYFELDNTCISKTLFSCNLLSDDYTSNSGWTSVNTDIKIANGVVKAVNVGANLKPNRIYKKFANKVLATDDWVLETSFTDQTPSNSFSCYELVSLTVDEMDPSVICTGTSTGCTINLNGKNNMVFTIVKPSNDVTKTYAILNLNDVASEQIIIKSGVKYFIRIEKKGSILTLSMFTDAARTVHETGSPKTITAKTLSDLNYIQHGVATKGGDFRSSYFELDNTCLTSVSVINGLNDLLLNNSESLNLEINPNPSSNFINVNAKGEAVSNVMIINSLGSVVMEVDSQTDINISQLAKGTYVVKSILKDKVYVSKFIKE